MACNDLSSVEKSSFMIMMLSLGGLPPFTGFLPKWITIQTMVNNEEYFMMIMFSMLTLLYYVRVMTWILNSSISMKWSYMKSNSLPLILSMMINLSLPLILILDIL